MLFVVEWLRRIKNDKHDCSIGERLAAALDAELLDFFKGVAKTGGVDQFERNSFKRNALGDEIAGCAGNGSDDGAISLYEAIKKRAFAGVWAPHDCHREAIVDNAASSEGSFKSGERRDEIVNASGDLGLRRYVYVILSEVDAGFEKCDELDQRLLDGNNTAAERPAHLTGGLASLGQGLRLDEIADGFGLREIEFSGEERTFGELSWFGKACAESDGPAEEKIENDGRAVRGDFDEVVTGIRVGGGEEGDDRIIDLFFGCFIEDGSETCSSVFERLAKADELGGNRCGIGAAEAHDPDPSAPGRGGDGGDGVDDGRRDFRDSRVILAHAIQL